MFPVKCRPFSWNFITSCVNFWSAGCWNYTSPTRWMCVIYIYIYMYIYIYIYICKTHTSQCSPSWTRTHSHSCVCSFLGEHSLYSYCIKTRTWNKVPSGGIFVSVATHEVSVLFESRMYTRISRSTPVSVKTHSFFLPAFALQSSSRNSSPAPDLLCFMLIVTRVSSSGGVLLFTDAGFYNIMQHVLWHTII